MGVRFRRRLRFLSAPACSRADRPAFDAARQQQETHDEHRQLHDRSRPPRARRIARDGAGLDGRAQRRARSGGDCHRARAWGAQGSERPRSRPRPRQGPRRRVHRPPDALRQGAEHDGRRLAASRVARRSDRRNQRSQISAERHPGRPDARAARRDRDHLRIAAERDDRCRRAVPQVRQRGDSARRLRGARMQHGAREADR